ncbi:hypothetical protein BDA99DRAFT_570111 [Phascolomyces articulosus]|uniref:Uncharacterized protein n=1 Tax=Phascolomyces articulosus TaxID=60185 RepID=A0AAD5K492_9FUNG|nr:hypothetical protein BDA99DRAFT_570111 [Phascolomyces articulosus]
MKCHDNLNVFLNCKAFQSNIMDWDFYSSFPNAILIIICRIMYTFAIFRISSAISKYAYGEYAVILDNMPSTYAFDEAVQVHCFGTTKSDCNVYTGKISELAMFIKCCSIYNKCRAWTFHDKLTVRIQFFFYAVVLKATIDRYPDRDVAALSAYLCVSRLSVHVYSKLKT